MMINVSTFGPGQYDGGLGLGFFAIFGPAIEDAVLTPVPVAPVVPAYGYQGDTLDITVNGSDFETDAVLTFSGADITVNSYSTRTTTQIVASITIGAGAAVGARDVIVTNSGTHSGTLTGAFSVADPAAAGGGLWMSRVWGWG